MTQQLVQSAQESLQLARDCVRRNQPCLVHLAGLQGDLEEAQACYSDIGTSMDEIRSLHIHNANAIFAFLSDDTASFMQNRYDVDDIVEQMELARATFYDVNFSEEDFNNLKACHQPMIISDTEAEYYSSLPLMGSTAS